MPIRFFFTGKDWAGNEVVAQLPVNPEEFTVNRDANNTTTEVIKLGEVTKLGGRKLIELSFQSFFPADENGSFVVTKGKFEPPKFYMDFFSLAQNNNYPIRFSIWDSLWGAGTGAINMLMSVEKFETTIKAGEEEDLYYILDLKEYKNPTARKVAIIAPETVLDETEEPEAVIEETLREKTGFAIGDAVIANGKYWYDSYGSGPYGTFNNFNGKISHIVNDASRPYRYHITTMNGGWRGWVSENQIQLA